MQSADEVGLSFFFGLHWVLVWKSLFPKLLFANFQNLEARGLHSRFIPVFLDYIRSESHILTFCDFNKASSGQPPLIQFWSCEVGCASTFMQDVLHWFTWQIWIFWIYMKLHIPTISYRSHRCGDSRQQWGDGLLVLPLFFESFFAHEPLSSLLSASRILDLPSCKFTQKFSATDSCAIWYHLISSKRITKLSI